MDLNLSETSKTSIKQKNHLLGQKLKSLAEDMVQLDRKLEREKQYYSTKIIGNTPSNKLSSEVSSESFYSTEIIRNDIMRSYGTGDAPLFARSSNPCDKKKLENYNQSSPLISMDCPIQNKKPEIAEVNPRLFFTWNSNMEDFHSKWIQKKLSNILENGSEERIHKDLFAKKLQTALSERSVSEEVLSNSSDESDPKQELAKEGPCCVEQSHRKYCHMGDYQDESFVHSYENRLKEVEEKCLNRFKLCDEESNLVTEGYQKCNDELLEKEAETETGNQEREDIIDEDLIIECFKDPDFTNYKSVPFAQVAKELETLERMLKTMNGLDVPKNVLEDY